MDLKTLPKAELHCHMDGIVDAKMVRQIKATHPDFPLNEADYAPVYDIHDMESFLTNYWIFCKPPDVRSIENRLVHHQPIVAQHIANLKAQNVRYAELLLASCELAPDRAQAKDDLQAFREFVTEQEADEIQVEFVLTVNRRRPAEQIAELGALALMLYEAGLVVGFAIAGPEPNYPIQPFTKTFRMLHMAGIPIEVHAGEWAGVESVRDALDYGYPTRLGHGVAAFHDAALLDEIREKNIHLEMCPACNVLTGAVPNIEAHPINRARELNMNYSINTDDPGATRYNMVDEYQLLVDTFGFSAADFETVYQNALAASFAKTLRMAH